MNTMLEYPELYVESFVEEKTTEKSAYIVIAEIAIQMVLLYATSELATYVWRLLSCPC